MLSKNRIKLITSLKLKKYRKANGLFVVEGIKTIKEFLKSNYKLEHLYTIELFENVDQSKQTLISLNELQKISFLKNTNSALAVFYLKEEKPIKSEGLIVALDNVRDPGNMGTIIRLCDWFGVKEIICGLETVDCFNPKVIQATMGSLTRVNVSYLDLCSFLGDYERTKPIYGAFMEGENVYTKEGVIDDGVLVMGNEANGISLEIEQFVTQKVAIPRFGELKETESLNVATATAILLSEFKRKTIEK